jgi:hypothetical protein
MNQTGRLGRRSGEHPYLPVTPQMTTNFPSRALFPLLAGLALALASCSEYGFLDDFPVYAPTQPYLDDQALLAKRVEAQRLERERREQDYRRRTDSEKSREWEELQARKERDVAAQRQSKAKRSRDRTSPHAKAEDIAEWNRIVGR